MTENEKAKITELRNVGYSYGQIAKLLNIPLNTVSSFCRRHNLTVKAITPGKIRPTYKLCPNCKGLFIAKGRQKTSHKFCSDKCRMNYWQREKYANETLMQEYEERMSLQEMLDSSNRGDDKSGGCSGVVLCCRPLLNNENTKP